MGLFFCVCVALAIGGIFYARKVQQKPSSPNPPVAVIDGQMPLDQSAIVAEDISAQGLDWDMLGKNFFTSSNKLISPDQEWFFEGARTVGDEPFSRGMQFLLQFRNLKGQGDRIVYLDWSERPDDALYSGSVNTVEPLGWSQDGLSVYTGYAKKMNDARENPLAIFENYWSSVWGVTRYDLSGPEFNYASRSKVQPGGENVARDGLILDFLPREDRALWFESSEARLAGMDDRGKETYPKQINSRLIFFHPSSSQSMIVGEWSNEDAAKVTSASLDRNEDFLRIAYALHREWKNDEVYFYESSVTSSQPATTTKIDLAPYRERLINEHGIQEPYQVYVEHTAMNFPSGLFLIIVGANDKATIMRFNMKDGQWSASIADDGWL